MSDPADAPPEAPAGMADTTLAFKLGEIAGHIITDGEVPYATDFVYSHAPAEELRAGLAGRLDKRGELWLPYHCLLITTPSQNLLIDAGLGRAMAAAWDGPAGRMLEGLAQLGFSPNDIDVVVISHAHPDHIGGLSDGANPTFPSARHVVEAASGPAGPTRTSWPACPTTSPARRERFCRCSRAPTLSTLSGERLR